MVLNQCFEEPEPVPNYLSYKINSCPASCSWCYMVSPASKAPSVSLNTKSGWPCSPPATSVSLLIGNPAAASHVHQQNPHPPFSAAFNLLVLYFSPWAPPASLVSHGFSPLLLKHATHTPILSIWPMAILCSWESGLHHPKSLCLYIFPSHSDTAKDAVVVWIKIGLSTIGSHIWTFGTQGIVLFGEAMEFAGSRAMNDIPDLYNLLIMPTRNVCPLIWNVTSSPVPSSYTTVYEHYVFSSAAPVYLKLGLFTWLVLMVLHVVYARYSLLTKLTLHWVNSFHFVNQGY